MKRTVASTTAHGHTVSLVRSVHFVPFTRITFPTFAYVVNGNALYTGSLVSAWRWYTWARDLITDPLFCKECNGGAA